jgi:ElaB/YqjD/DUF883 family membrane-anchored ribosome-binding protein
MSNTFTLLFVFAMLFAPAPAGAQEESEPNNTLASADALPPAGLTGRIGCEGAADRDDYFRAESENDGTLRLLVTYTNRSGNSGADATAYLFDGNGALLLSQSRYNVPAGSTVTDTLTVYGRQRGPVFFRLYSTFCFDYSIQYALLPAPTGNDPEDNGTLATAGALEHDRQAEGRIGYSSNGGQDRDDYWRAELPDDGTVRLSLTLINTSNNGGADATVYIYDGDGTLLASQSAFNVPAGGTREVDLSAFCRARDEVFFRIYSTFSFGYRIRYVVDPPPTDGDREDNDSFATAAEIDLSADTEGRLGYLDATDQDRDDYFRTELNDDGTIRLIVTYFNTSNNGGADATAYIYGDDRRLLRSSATFNVAADGSRTDTLFATGRARDEIYVRLYTTYCFGYSLRIDLLEPETGGDEEPNNNISTAAPIAHRTATEGRVGFTSGTGQDRDDYFRAVLPDDGTVRLTVTYLNESSNSGADATAYLYDGDGTLLTSKNNFNQPTNVVQTDTLHAYGRARDTVYFRLYSTFSFGYRIEYELLPAPTAPDPETNDALTTAAPISVNTEEAGRIGYSDATTQDRDDYWQAILPDDGTVRLNLTFANTSNNAGADVTAYIYDGDGTLLTSNTLFNLATNGEFDLELTAYCRARDTVYFRIYSTFSFGYRINYELLEPPTGPDPEANHTLTTAAPIGFDELTDGRIGYLAAATQDRDDYWYAVLPDDGAVRLAVTYYNTSNNDGANATAYIYDGAGRVLTSLNNFNQPTNAVRTDTLIAYGRARDTVYFRVYSTFCFGYQLRYDLIRPAFAADTEPNDVLADATPIGTGAGITGRVGFTDRAQDRDDYFRLVNEELASFTIHLAGENASNNAGADLFLYVLGEGGRVLQTFSEFNLAPGRFNRTFTVNCVDRQTVYLRLYSTFAFAYDLDFEVTAEQPHASIEYSRFGNRFAFVANSRRAETIEWDFDDGMTSSARYPVKEFPIGAYDVSLEASNTACDVTSITEERIVVNGVESYTPRRAGKAEDFGYFSLRLFGAGFSPDTRVTLSQGGTVVTPARMLVPEDVELTALFEFDGLETGLYDLSVTLASGETYDFPDGFEIFADAPGFDIEVDAVGPSRIRTNRWTNYTLNITNDRARLANGVVVGVVIPGGVESNLDDVINRRSGHLAIKGDVWDMLEINRDDFNEEFFGGTFDPNVDTVFVDYDLLDEQLGPERGIAIDTLYNEPLRGTLYLIYVPAVLGETTIPFPFQLRSPTSQSVALTTFARPETWRNNPPTGKQLDATKQAALEAAAILELTGVPAFKVLGESVGYVDIGSQVLFTEFFDAWYGVNNADAGFYRDRAMDLAVEVGGKYIPSAKHSANSSFAAEQARANMKRTSKNINKVESLLDRTGKGRLKKARAKNLAKLREMRRRLEQQGQALTEAEKQAYLADLETYVTKKGINYAKNEIQDALGDDPGDACSTRPKKIKKKPVTSIRSFDPNAIYGNPGVGQPRYVRRDEPLNYLITFENVDTAEAAAQIVRVETRLDPAVFDLSATVIGDVFIAERMYTLEGDRSEYFADLDLRPAQDLIVRVNAKLDTVSGDFVWQFTSLDPATMELTRDVDAGFLPPNVNVPEGEGGIYFTTRLRADTENGDTLSARASIYFDDNDPILTNTWSNVIDEAPPASRLEPAYTQLDDTTVRVTYFGADGASGLKDYYLRARRAGEAWSSAEFPLLANGSSELILDRDVTYEFYVVAQDSVGNREVKAPRAELRVTLGTVSTGSVDDRATSIQLYPNPTRADVTYLLPSESLRGVTITVVDARGQVRHRLRTDLVADSPFPLATTSLPGGVYVIQLVEAGRVRWADRLLVVRN